MNSSKKIEEFMNSSKVRPSAGAVGSTFEHGGQGYLDDFRRKKQLICHRHVDDFRDGKNLIQYVWRETVRHTV